MIGEALSLSYLSLDTVRSFISDDGAAISIQAMASLNDVMTP